MAMKRTIAMLTPALLLGLLLTGCSNVHELLNPPSFTPPVKTSAPNQAPPPTYVQPGTSIKSLRLTSGQPETTTFTSSSIGFRVLATCPQAAGGSTQVKVEIQGATSSSKGGCGTTPIAILQLATPEAVDGKGVPVKLTLQFDGAANTNAKIDILNGANTN